ncbi:hypothetical protein DFP94_102306 [Fontibacillus phaseoli]|uniref:DUF5703 domain-containing protein n=1 Tax=Fontibacillus phaseoli TaxID=1416533 RepID=A0A369BJ00_9BACL|nr:DUF5703 domain-containing protein [Fontibacillus phaseoli]RCX21553.1 hypothetical protein DFP94_102306 [Fontibacillus phaseoli]
MMEKYNVVWTSQSNGSADSMPLGGYDTGCNIWVENNYLYLYVSESGTFDENCTMLKLARLRIWIEDRREIFEKNFIQELHLEEGYINIQAGDEGDKIRFRIWAAVTKPEIHIEYQSDQPHSLRAALENWRYREREVSKNERHQCRDYEFGYPGRVVTYPDVVETREESICFYHRNKNTETAWNHIIQQQQLESVQDKIPNPLHDRTMGGILTMKGMQYSGEYEGIHAGTDFLGYSYETTSAVTNQEIILTLHTKCCGNMEIWKGELAQKAGISAVFEKSVQWWKNYFQKSYIYINKNDEQSSEFRLGKNYQLFRYMLGCNYYGEYPTKFNGGLFTFDEGKTPDFRCWSGGGFTSQNQRLVYWGMLKTGDFESMRVQLDFFKNLTEGAKARVNLHFRQKGAFFYEQGNIFGTCTGAEYGWNRSPEISTGLEDNAWVRLHFSSGLEFALMMLEYSRYTGESIEVYMNYIENILDFYMEYYPLDEEGKLYLFPSTALETFKGDDPHSKNDTVYGCANPMDAVAGIRCVLEGLIDYLKDKEKTKKYRDYLERCPELPIGVGEAGGKVFLPAESYSPKPFNCELPQLYRIFPFSPFGLTEEEREIGRNTYRQPFPTEEMYLGVSWHQNGIFAARLGLIEEAWKYLYEKFDNAPKRFPTFWGPGHDWTPDHNHGGSGIIGLQEMLMQCDKDKIRLFPAWDKNKDVSFKLYAPQNTLVECDLKDGEVTYLHVMPEARKKDIEIQT